MTAHFRELMPNWISGLQKKIVDELSRIEGRTDAFQTIEWKRPAEEAKDGGGGISKILSDGRVFEKAGVNISVVEGNLPALMKERLNAQSNVFFASGISLVIHPRSPKIPTVHANFRYFEQPDRAWFGGGVDLTPYVSSPEDFRHFHSTLKSACDLWKPTAYSQFKKDCDQYFFIPHRGETRGVGGIFFDYLMDDMENVFRFVKNCGEAFLPAYVPIVEKQVSEPYSDREKKFQLLRRGRYVEFNLVYDRGTLFGLQTKGNIESILMSLPPEVHFEFDPSMQETTSEKLLMSWFKNPVDWV